MTGNRRARVKQPRRSNSLKDQLRLLGNSSVSRQAAARHPTVLAREYQVHCAVAEDTEPALMPAVHPLIPVAAYR